MTFYFGSLSYSIEIAWQFRYSGKVSPETPQRKIQFQETLSCFANKIFKGNSFL